MNPPSLSQTSLALLAGATFFAGEADAVNLVTNGSFDPDATGWTGTGTLYNHPYNGLAGIKLANTGGAQSNAATGNFNFNSLAYGYNDNVTVPIGAKFHGLSGGTQTINEAALTAAIPGVEIDAGGAAFAFSAWLSSYTGDNNIPALRLRFFSSSDGTGTLLGTEYKLDRGTTANQVTTANLLATGNIMNGAENSGTDPDYWALYKIKAGVPVGARSAIVDFVNGTGHGAGGQNDWYADAIVLDVVSVPVLRWTGGASSEWSTATVSSPKNWELISNPGTGVDFTALSPVIFGETGSRNVALNGADVLPSTVNFSHTTGNYALTGTHGIGGSTGVTLTGTGTLTLSQPNSYTGTTLLTAGALVINHSLALQNSTLSGTYPDSTHAFGNVTAATLGGLSGTADLALLNPSVQPVALTLGGNNAGASNNGQITGSGSITKIGTGNQTLAFANSYSGGTTVASGTLIAGTETAFGTGTVTSTGGIIEFAISSGSESTVANNFVLPGGTGDLRMFGSFGSGRAAPGPGTAVRLTGKISGGDPARQFFFSDTGIGVEHDNATIFANATNDFTGTVFINRATIGFTSDAALGNPENNITHFSENLNGKLRFEADNIVLNPLRAIDLPSTENSRPFDTQGFIGTIAGPVSGTGILVKQGTGKLILTSTANTLTGPVNVTTGTLQVDGNLPTSASVVTVTTDGTLAGSGTVQRSVTLTGGKLAPGSGVGTLNGLAALTVGASSAIDFELSNWNGAAGTGYDTVVADSINVTATPETPATVIVTPQTLANFSDTQKTFTLVSTSGGITGFTPDAFVVNADALPAATAFDWSVQVQGTNLVLVYGEPAGTPFENWATSKGLTGDNALFDADPDKDGISNGIEFVIGGEPNPANPGSNSTALLPTASRNGAGALVFVYRLADDAAPLNPVVKYDTDLAGPWTTAEGGENGVLIEVLDDDTDIDIIQVTIPVSQSVGGKLFARLAVTE
ncbi:autotransporter-associated beta strand repeat-containing protein [Luteolibacter arcticus]|uniref:Autotransporter-associated beta strand repeat-containing protein n=1 Tax=Luteolibacter arcticus TaxID=1581411 RepID=A0ABT3GQI7_9BACT|nr:autotransporter-associated beta strand repeat-containing protein [Luteolibacter arcticus]MCW1925745.1 autotransporter-associated beta strand repeat-containing protein [Luteolibacter arcticus]